MAGEEMAKQTSESRRRSRAGSNLNANFNGGGVLLLLGAAAGALLASAFAAHRIRAHKRRRGSTTEGIQGDSCEHLASHEAKEFVGNEEGAGDVANGGEGVVQASSHENLDASVQISRVVQREINFLVLEEGKGEVVERSPVTDGELVDGEYGKLAGCRDSSADICSSPANACGNLDIGISSGETLLRYDSDELVASSVKEERKISCIISKEVDEEDSKSSYKVEWGEWEEIEGKNTSSNLYSEQSGLLEENSSNHLHLVEAPEFVMDEEEAEGGANTKERRVQANICDDLHGSLEILDSIKGESDIYFDDKVAERSLAKEIELVDSVEGELAKIDSSSTNIHNNLKIDSSLRKVQLKYDDEQLVVDSIREEIETPFNRKEDEEDNKIPNIEQWGKMEELEGNITHLNQNTEEFCLSEKKAFQNLEMVIAIEERKFEDHFMDEVYSSILEFVFSRSKEREISSPLGDQDEINPLIKEIEPFFGSSGEAKNVLDMTQNDLGKHLDMVIKEDKIVMESGAFKDVLRLDILSVEQENENEDGSDDKMVEGSRNLCEQTVALPHDSSVTIISEVEENSCKDSIMVTTKDDVQVIAHINGIVPIEENKMMVEESDYLLDEGVEGSINEIQGNKTSIHDNPTMHVMIEEKIQFEDIASCDLNDAIQEEKAEANLSNGFIKNMESSETEEILREHEEFSLTDSNTVEFSLERDNLMAFNESPLIQFQGIEPIEREDKACLEDGLPLSPELNMKIVQPIQENKLNNSEKTLVRKECQAGNQELWTFSDEVEREDEIISVQDHELETRQFIEVHNDNLEREIEYPQILSVVKKGVGEIHKESQAQIEEEEEEKEDDGEEDEKILKRSFDFVDKGGKIMVELIDADRENQCQIEDHGSNVSSKGEQQQIAIKKVKGIEYMFMGYHKGHMFLVTTSAIVFTVLIFLYTKDFITRTTILENFVTG